MVKLHRNRQFQFWIMLFAVFFIISIPSWNGDMVDEPIPKFYAGDTISCDILLDKSLKAKGYTIGYLYELFSKFERDQGLYVQMTPEHFNPEEWKKLNDGEIDMLIISQKDTVPEIYQSEFISSTVLNKDGVICVAKKENYHLIQTINYWISNFKHTEEYVPIIARYFKNYKFKDLFGKNVIIPKSSLSPYDNLIKRYSKPLGWDWRLVASLIYQESKFKAGVSSSKGAIGLMQIKEATGRAFGIENIYDPEDNIKAGTAYLKKLNNLYLKKGADSTNAIKLALAAYNSGDGRIEDCMVIAHKEGLNPLVWEDIKEAMPLLNKEEHYLHPDIKYGKFKGKETVKFVNEIMERYDNYKLTVSK